MEVTQQRTDDGIILKVDGEIDKNTSPVLEVYILTAMNDNDNLVLDFNDVAYISSACLRILLSVQKKINFLEKAMKIINCNNTVKEIFEMSGFTKYIDIA